MPAESGRAVRASRRAFAAGIGGAVAVLTALTVGQTLTPLGGIAVFAPRRKGAGPQAVPVNRTARQAGVVDAARHDGWALEVVHGARRISLAREALAALPQQDMTLPIACVEGWSQQATWGGVRLSLLLDRVDAPHDADIRLTSLEQHGSYKASTMQAPYARDPRTTVALRLGGDDLDVDHGYPARIIAPGRPGVLQTKWLTRIEVLS